MPLVLLHGLGGSRLSWEPQLGALPLSAERRVLAWELPGYGASAPSEGPLTFDSLAAAVVDFAGEAGIGRRFHLAGVSFGGMIAQYVAALHAPSVASLVLLATSPRFGLDGTRPDEWRAARLAPLDAGREPRDIAAAVLRSLAGPRISDAALAGQEAAMARVRGAALRRAIECLVTHDSTALLPKIVAPTLCLVGALDEETPPAYCAALAASIPGARMEVLDGAGHLLNVEAPERVNALIAAHIAASRRAPRMTPGSDEHGSRRSRP